LDAWQYVVERYGNGLLSMYVDGEEVYSSSIALYSNFDSTEYIGVQSP